MSQEKEDYEVGIPLDDLSPETSAPDPDSDEREQPDALLGNEENFSEPEEEVGVGLPSLFDEEELAEVGLKASPLEDGEATEDSDEADADHHEEAIEHQAVEAGVETDESPDDQASATEMEGLAENVTDPIATHGDADLETDGMTRPEDSEIADAFASEHLPENLQTRLDAIHVQMVQLQDEFEGKLKYDAHKDQIIDKLHQELQEYKQDIVKKHILSIVLDVVKVADDIRKWITYFRSLDVSQRDPVKLFRYLEAIPSDLEDIFYWQGVKPYVNQEGAFNPATQRAIKKVPTDDIAKDKTIAKSIRPGYEWEGKVIRQEMVAVYVCEESNPSVDTRDIDE